jgi:hypothetical protein
MYAGGILPKSSKIAQANPTVLHDRTFESIAQISAVRQLNDIENAN